MFSVFYFLHLLDTEIKNDTKNSFKDYNTEFSSSIKEPKGNICAANEDTGEKCYNPVISGSLYCNKHKPE